MHLVSAPTVLAEHGADGRARPGQARGLLPRRLALAGAVTALLAACGRKSNPEPPPGIPKDAFPKQYPPKGS
jgi:putative lipoprotein